MTCVTVGTTVLTGSSSFTFSVAARVGHRQSIGLVTGSRREGRACDTRYAQAMPAHVRHTSEMQVRESL